MSSSTSSGVDESIDISKYLKRSLMLSESQESLLVVVNDKNDKIKSIEIAMSSQIPSQLGLFIIIIIIAIAK
jgi:hypothetical protein